MVLQRQIIDIPIGAGVDEITGVMSVAPGKLAIAKNARIVDVGTCEQRPGYTAIPVTTLTGGSITTARRLMRCGSEILLDDGTALNTFCADTATWKVIDRVPEFMVDKRIPGERGIGALGCNYDVMYASGLFVHAWVGRLNLEDTTGRTVVRVRVTDELTGARLAVSEFDCALDSEVRVIAPAGSGHMFLFYEVRLPGEVIIRNLVGRIMTLTDPETWGPEVVIGQVADRAWDVQPAGPFLIAAYASLDLGPTNLCLELLNSALGTIDTCIGTELPSACVAVCSDPTDGRVYVAYQTAANGLRVDRFTSSPALVLEGTTIVDALTYDTGISRMRCTGICPITGSAAVVYSLYTTGADYPAETRSAKVSSSGALTTLGTTYHVLSVSVPRKLGNCLYVLGHMPRVSALHEPAPGIWSALCDTAGYTPSPSSVALGGQSWAYLLEIPLTVASERIAGAQARPVCRLGWGQARESEFQKLAIGFHLCGTGWVLPVGMAYENKASTADTVPQEGWDNYVIDVVPSDVPLGAEQDGELVMSGGVPSIYCGDRVSEYNFNYYPFLAVEQNYVKGALLTPGKTYGYAIVFLHRDARGVAHRSAPAYVSVLLSNEDGNNAVSLGISAYTLTTREDLADESNKVEAEVYRTGPDGQIHHYLGSIQNDRTTHTLWFTDLGSATLTDAVMETRRILYTTGGVFENIAPPASRHLIEHNNRLWTISADDVDRLWCSKLLSLRESPGFNEILTYRIPGADLVAIASLDNKLIAFGRNGVWYVSGSGPSDTNQNNDLAEPTPIAPELGCTDARSVCRYPDGVTFQSTDGLLYVVGRDMGARCVSLAVYDTLHAYPVIQSVTYIPDDHEIRVLASKSNGSATCILVWNVLLDQWHVWSTKNASGTVEPYAVSGELVAWTGEPDRYAMLLNSGVVHRESGYTDPDGTYPTVTVRTGPLRVAGLQHYQRVWDVGILFEKLSVGSHSDVTLTVHNNYLTASSTWTETWTAAQCAAAQTVPRLQLLAHVPMGQQKCETMALQVSWTPVVKNLRFQGLSIQCGIKQGRPRVLPAAARK